MGILISLATGLFIVELYAWLPRLALRLLRFAVSRLPPRQRERYREEWEAHLDALPNTTARLFAALGFCRAAFRITIDLVSIQLTTINDKIAKLAIAVSEEQAELRRAKSSFLDQRRSQKLETVETEFNDHVGRDRDPAMKELIETAQETVNVLVGAVRRGRSLTDALLDRVDARLARASNLLGAVSHEFDLLDKRGPHASECMHRLLATLEDVRNNLEHPPEERKLIEQHADLTKRLRTATRFGNSTVLDALIDNS